MKRKLLAILFFVLNQFGYSQTEKSLKGVVRSEDVLLQGVEVVNLNTKKIVITNGKGEFLIDGKVNDSLFFYAKKYTFKQIKITHQLFNENNTLIELTIKPEELQEVVVSQMPSIRWKKDSNHEQQKADQYAIEKNASRARTVGVYDGTIENGMNFVRIGKMILGLFSKEKEPQKKEAPLTEFKVFAKAKCNQKYFTETLKLKPEEIELFLDYCDADPKSQEKATTKNVLSVMDYLLAKNISFQEKNNNK